MEKKLLVSYICIGLIIAILFTPNVSANTSMTLSVEIHRIQKLDIIEESGGSDEADWYYYVGVSEDGGINYDWTSPAIPMINDEDDWIVDITHDFHGIKNTIVTIAIMLCEDDGWTTPDDELADISSDPSGGSWDLDNPIEPPSTGVRPGTYVGHYDIETNTLTGNATTKDFGYYKTSGEYDGNSGDEIDAALWFDIKDSCITITSPISGNIWCRGEVETITWDSENAGNYVKIELYRSGSRVSTITSSTSNDGRYSWTIPSGVSTSSSYTIKITSLSYSSVYDESGYFSIQETPRYIYVTSPSSSETLYKGETHEITWNSLNAGSNVKIQYKIGSYYYIIASSTSNDGSYSWAIPSSLSTSSSYKIKISSTSYSSVEDESDYFSIDERYITVNSLYSGSKWYEGETYSITWSSKNAGSSVKIELYKSSSRVSTITSSTSNDGSHSWKIPSSLTSSSYYKIRITSTSFSSVYDDSSSFSIDRRYITVNSPSGGGTCYKGETKTITWNSDNAGSYVKIELYKNGKYHSTIVSSTSNDGRYSWTIPTSLSTGSSYKMKITSISNSNVYDYSNTYLTIKETWLQKWLWAVAIAVLAMIILIGVGMRTRAKIKKKKRIFEKGKEEIKDIIRKATAKKKVKKRKVKVKKKKQKTGEKGKNPKKKGEIQK